MIDVQRDLRGLGRVGHDLLRRLGRPSSYSVLMNRGAPSARGQSEIEKHGRML